MTAESTELELKLIERIKRDGPLTFRDFMHAALYDPELGYYNTQRQKIGAAGDYYTSSNVHSAFGAVLASTFCEAWAGESNGLVIIESGPGTGQLAHDILSALRSEHPKIFDDLTYVLVETSPALQSRQRDKLIDFGRKIRWRSLDDLAKNPIRGIAVSNEFVDALPVHRARLAGDSLQELYVSIAEKKGRAHLARHWGPPSTKSLAQYLECVGVTLEEGQIVEISLDATAWLERISQALECGFLITIDYGDTAQDLYTPRRKSGTLRCFHRHEITENPFERVGDQDLTSSVNFTALIEYGRDYGFQFVTFERQTDFLIRNGLIERVAAEYGSDALGDSLSRRLAVKNLFVPGGLSDSFRVLIQRREGAASPSV
jgi:SAM-dependent MidA family methyltransferase